MYLKRVELLGFKSFANKTKIEINNNITAIVGPNGSGKSNVSDAIMWALGEQSIKTLRGNKMEDVIFSGTKKRKPLGYAEVTLLFDNNSNALPINYSEVSISRKMFRSGESQFFINKTRCRLKDIRELFMDTGIGKDGYSIIGQGKIESILSDKPEDRRSIFEEAAGITKFKSKKMEAQRNLEKTNFNLIRLEDIIIEIGRQEDELAQEAKRAKMYLDLFEEMKSYELNYFMDQREELLKEFNDNELALNKIKIELQNTNNDLEKASDFNKTVKFQQLSLENEVEKLQERKLQTSGDLEKLISSINLLIERKENLESNIHNNKLEIKELDGKNKEYESIEADILSKIHILKVELDENSSQLKDITKNLNSKKDELKNSEDIKKTIDVKYMNAFQRSSEIDSSINTLSSMLEEKKSRILQIKSRLDLSKKDNNEINLSIDNCSKEIEAYEKKFVNIEKNLYILDCQKQEIEKEKKEIESEIVKLQLEVESNRTRLNILKSMDENYEGYNKSVKSFLIGIKKNNLFTKDILGTVAENFKSNTQFEKAISVALGSAAQNIIVKNSNSVNSMIKYLLNNNLGRVTFLPMDTISGNKVTLNAYNEKDENILGRASDLIEYAENFDNIFKFLLGRIIVVKDMDIGLKLAKSINFKNRIIALNGESINIGGSITGGKIYESSSNIINRKPQIKELVRLLDTKNTDLHSKKTLANNLQEKAHLVEGEINKTKILIQNNREDINKYKLKLEMLNKGKDTNSEYIARYISEVENLDLDIQNDEIKIEEYMVEKNEVSNIILTISSETSNINNLIENNKKEISEDNSNLTIYQVKIRENELKINSLENRIIDLKKSKEDRMLKERFLNDSVVKMEAEIEKNKSEIEKYKLEEIEIKSSLDLINQDYSFLKDKRVKVKEDLEEHDEKLSHLNKMINRLENKDNRIALKNERITDRLAIIEDQCQNKYKLSSEDIYEYFDENIERLDLFNTIKELQDKIEEMGSVNLNSIVEYHSVKERLEFNLNQKNDLVISQEKINNIIQNLEQEMRTVFKKAFEEIAESFNEIFIQLFSGGKATLELDNENNILSSGIEIKAQPPGKRLQSLSLLSGGERSLTAVALLFAILRQRPAPFCILDEIDAALDDANIKKYIDYLKSIENIQFIIITHRKITMEIANVLYGITMEEQGISSLISLELEN